jgi:hypothetical protein
MATISEKELQDNSLKVETPTHALDFKSTSWVCGRKAICG